MQIGFSTFLSGPATWTGAHGRPIGKDETYALCESPHSPDFNPKLKRGGYGKIRFIRTRTHKLVAADDDTWELYDLADDPYELNNRYGEPGTEGIAGDLTRMLVEQMMLQSNPGVSGCDVSSIFSEQAMTHEEPQAEHHSGHVR